MSEEKPDVFEWTDDLIKKGATGDPRFRPINYAEAYGRLSGMIQHLAIRASFNHIDHRSDILRVSREERELRELIEAQQKANLESKI